MDWYTLFLIAVVLLWLGATDADRNALRIVLIATLTSLFLVEYVTRSISGAWKLVVPATLETATILALLHWAPNRTGLYQAVCVLVAWMAHLMCFTDIQFGTDLIYSRYEAVLAAVALAQILLFHETYLHHLRQMGHWWGFFRSNRAGAFHAPSSAVVVPHNPRHPRLSPASPCPTICTKQ